MALTRDQIVTLARAELHEPTDGRYYNDSEMYSWLNLALDEICSELVFEKKTISISGATIATGAQIEGYLPALGESPKYYQLPTDFMILDENFGVNFDGIRRLPLTDRELEQYQQYAFGRPNVDTYAEDTTLTVDDYFAGNLNGSIMHYGINYFMDDSVSNGYLMWFTPNPDDSTIINFRYVPLPEEFSGSGDTSNIMRQFQQLLVFGLIKNAIRKKVVDGEVGMNVVEMYEYKFEKMLKKAKAWLKNKGPDKVRRFKTAREVYGYNNSQRLGDNNWNYYRWRR